MKKKRVLLIGFVLGLSMLIVACAPAMMQANEAPAMEPAWDVYEEAMMEEPLMAEAERGVDAGSGELAKAVERMVIYNADLQIAVQDPESAMQAVIQMAEDAGGFVVYSNVQQTQTASGRLPHANLTVRVPADQLDSIMSAIKDLTPNRREDVLSENVSGQDVTAEFTDLASRLRNLEAAEDALVALMEEAQDPQDVLDVFGELTYYRGEIEVVKGRMQYLEESVALSAISVEIVAKESIQPIEIAGWEPRGTIRRAIEALIEAAQFLADATIWFGIFCLPFLIPLGLGIYFLVRLIRKRKAKKKAKEPEVIEHSDPDIKP
jgi:hypothetical protein